MVDNLVLIRVVATLHATLCRLTLRELRQEAPHRFRGLFVGPDATRSLAISVRPEMPWIARPMVRGGAAAGAQGRFAASLTRALQGRVLEAVRKEGADRVVRLVFADGHELVVELATHGANLVLLGPGQRVVEAMRRPARSRSRLVPGQRYVPPPLPALPNPFDDDAETIDRQLRERQAEGHEPIEALRRGIFGVGTPAAELVLREAAESGESPGSVLLRRVSELVEGRIDPVVESPQDPLAAANAGTLERRATRIHPWPPRSPAPGSEIFVRADPAATAGLYYEAIEGVDRLERRLRVLRSVLDAEIERNRAAEQKAENDHRSFEDPEQYRRWGEALLAGLSEVQRVGELIRVPDPYSVDREWIGIPAPADRTPKRLADELFERHRRARRGRLHARRRADELSRRAIRLEELHDRAGSAGPAEIENLVQAMREAGIPVGLEPNTRSGRATARDAKPRKENVRMFTTRDGASVLVGKSGKDNHRLTFKLASPEDFWFHAQGCPGAHVVLRGDSRFKRPPEETLREVAAIAAWFSEAQRQPWVDVQWTRRKYVRRPRGAAAGTVVLKRFETIRVRPKQPIS